MLFLLAQAHRLHTSSCSLQFGVNLDEQHALCEMEENALRRTMENKNTCKNTCENACNNHVTKQVANAGESAQFNGFLNDDDELQKQLQDTVQRRLAIGKNYKSNL